MTDPWKEVRACGPCNGKGYREYETGIREECEFCGGNGARRNCHQRDCYEYGCSFGYCHVPDNVAREKGFPL